MQSRNRRCLPAKQSRKMLRKPRSRYSLMIFSEGGKEKPTPLTPDSSLHAAASVSAPQCKAALAAAAIFAPTMRCRFNTWAAV